MKRGFSRRRLAAFVAIFALLAQGFAPVLHFALGTALAGSGRAASAGPHVHHADNGEGRSDEGSHGPCHFCRVFGAALPPPPVVELMQLEPARFAFASFASRPPPAPWTSRAHGARAPPAPSDRQPKIAIA